MQNDPKFVDPKEKWPLKPEDLTFENIKAECFKAANEKTHQANSNFVPDWYIIDANYRVYNSTTREWYNQFTAYFNEKFKPEFQTLVAQKKKTLEEYAKIAYEIRHFARSYARFHMKELDDLEMIQARDSKMYSSSDGPKFEWLLIKEITKQELEFEKMHKGEKFNEKPIKDGGNFDLDLAYNKIIASSTQTNNMYNLAHNYGSLTAHDQAGDSLEKVKSGYGTIFNVISFSVKLPSLI